MEMITAQEAAAKWGISLRRVQDYCKSGKIRGAERFGRNWMIPGDAVRPVDGRTRDSRERQLEPQRMPRKTAFLSMTDLYNTPGRAAESIAALAENPEAQKLLAAEIAYSQGRIDEVYGEAYYLLHRHTGMYAVIAGGMLLALCAIWRGDLSLWRQAKIHISEAGAKSELEREIVDLSLSAVDSMLYDVAAFPEWFKNGRFTFLPGDALPAAGVFYAKYLYASAYAVATREIQVPGVQGLTLMGLLPATVEPLIAHAAAGRAIVAEAYLRLTCAVIYHNSGNNEQAVYHIDRALDLLLPDKLYGLLAEYCRTLGMLLEQRLTQRDPAAWTAVAALYQVYLAGWSRLSGAVRGRQIITTLSPRQREIAKLAAFGMKNEEIARTLHISVSAVKQAITNVSNKTGMSRSEFAAVL